MLDLNSEFGGLKSSFSIPNVLKMKLQALPRKPEVTLRFVDFDGTLMDDEARFRLDPELLNHRQEKAIPYIKEKYPDGDDQEEFDHFLSLLDPKSLIFQNIDDFYDRTNPHDYILSAGPVSFQDKKITRAFPSGSQKILLFNAKRKPLKMLLTCLKLGFIPGKIQFYDDRIKNFDGIDVQMGDLLDIPVEFYRALPEYAQHKVAIQRYTSEISRILENN